MRSSLLPTPTANVPQMGRTSAAVARAGTQDQQAGEGARVAGRLFAELRKALRLTVPEAAQRVGTRIDVIVALESGVVGRLPPWPETARIVGRYTGLAGIDARPVLDVLRRAQDEDIRTLDPAHIPASAPVTASHMLSAPAESKPGMTQRLTASAGAGARRIMQGSQSLLTGRVRQALTNARPKLVRLKWVNRRSLAVFAAVPFIFILAMSDSRIARAAATFLPSPLAAIALGINDLALRAVSSRREGLVWIDAADPQVRKGDKLHSGHR